MNAASDRARIIAPPPLLALGCIGLGFLARHFRPLHLFKPAHPLQVSIGVLIMASSICIIAFAGRSFIAHGTHPNPYRPTKALVVTGVHGFTRNPMYVAGLLFVLSFTLLANSFWFVISAGLLFVSLHFGVVKREEIYLRQKFGESYEQYCSCVRRWI